MGPRGWGRDTQLIPHHRLDGDELAAAQQTTAGHRGITLCPPSVVIGDLAVARQAPYTAWLRPQGPATADHLELFAEVTAFAGPLPDDTTTSYRWDRRQSHLVVTRPRVSPAPACHG